jgi:hypothetical protein
MNKTTMNEQQIERPAYLLHVLVEGHFVEGEVQNKSAYACAALARKSVDQLRGNAYDNGMIDFYEKNPKFVPMMFPDDSTVEKQIAQLKDTCEMLGRQCSPLRHKMMMMPTSTKGGHPAKPGRYCRSQK